MKKTKFYLLSILFLGLSFITTSCDDDDDDDVVDTTNTFTIDNKSYSFSNAVGFDYGSNGNGSDDIDVVIYSSGISYNAVNEEFSGKGNAVYLDLNVTSGAKLENGTYTFGTTRAKGFLVDGEAYVGVDATTFSSQDELYTVTSGTVVVSSASGGNKTITFDLKTTDGVSVQNVKGNYTGSVVVFS